MELVKTSRPLATIFGRSFCTKRTAKIVFGLIAAVFLLQFYCVRELVFMEAVLALGFVVVALIVALYASATSRLYGCENLVLGSRLLVPSSV